MSEEKVPEPDSEMQEVEDTASSHPDEPPAEGDSLENNPMDVAEDPIKEQPKSLENLQEPKDASPSKLVMKSKSPIKSGLKPASPSKSPVKVSSPMRGKRQSPSKPSEDVQSPSKRKSLEVKTTDKKTMKVSSSNEFEAGCSSFSSPSSTIGEFQSISRVSQSSSDLSNPSPATVSEASSSSSLDPSHVCHETCIHGGARPKKKRALMATAPPTSSAPNDGSRILEQMNRFAERMESNFPRNPEYFGDVTQQQWITDHPNVFAEDLANQMGHGPFVHTPSTSDNPYNFPTILQLNRMLSGLSLENMCPVSGHRMERIQEADQSPSYVSFQQDLTIDIDQVPEPTRPMDADEVLLSSFSGWRAPDVEPEPTEPATINPEEQEKAVEPPEEPRREYRLIRLALPPPTGSNVITPSNPYRYRDNDRWRTAMLAAYRTERYHTTEQLDELASQLEREGVSEEDFFRSYHSARLIDLVRDEGMEELRSGPEREEITIEDKINRTIIRIGFMTVAMLYMRMYISRHPEIETSSESSTMDSGNVDRSESEPKEDYSRLREHVNIDLGSPDNTSSPKGIESPDCNSPQEIQSPDFVPSPTQGSPVNILVPLSEVPPKSSDTPSSQGSLLAEGDPSGSSSSSKKGPKGLRRAVLDKCHSQSLDNTSGDASPIQPDDEEYTEEQQSFGDIIARYIQQVFIAASDIKKWEDEERLETGERGDEDVETGETSGDPRIGLGEAADAAEDPKESDPVSQTPRVEDSNEGPDSKETDPMEVNVGQPGGVASVEDNTSDSKCDAESAELKEEEEDGASGSCAVEDDSKTDDLGEEVSRSGQRRKRKDHSDIDEDRLPKRGKES